jgi:hypothetical protein
MERSPYLKLSLFGGSPLFVLPFLRISPHWIVVSELRSKFLYMLQLLTDHFPDGVHIVRFLGLTSIQYNNINVVIKTELMQQ